MRNFDFNEALKAIRSDNPGTVQFQITAQKILC